MTTAAAATPPCLSSSTTTWQRHKQVLMPREFRVYLTRKPKIDAALKTP